MCVDDCLCISKDHESIIRNKIGKYFKVKEASIGEPDIYLGGKVCKVELKTGVECWAFSSSQYVQEACRNVRQCLEQQYKAKDDHKTFHLPKKAGAPMSTNYRPEIDIGCYGCFLLPIFNRCLKMDCRIGQN